MRTPQVAFLQFPLHPFERLGKMNQRKINIPWEDLDSPCSKLYFPIAERELAVFLRAAAELFGPEQATLAAAAWLYEFDAIDGLPASTREWRQVTVNAATRLAGRMNSSPQKNELRTVRSNRHCVFLSPAPRAL
jgi:hypothetical protein